MDIFFTVLAEALILPLPIILHAPGLLILRLLTIHLQRNIIIIKRLFKLPKLIQTSTPSQKRINMRRIQLDNNRKILNSILDLIQFLMRTANKIISIDIPTINV